MSRVERFSSTSQSRVLRILSRLPPPPRYAGFGVGVRTLRLDISLSSVPGSLWPWLVDCWIVARVIASPPTDLTLPYRTALPSESVCGGRGIKLKRAGKSARQTTQHADALLPCDVMCRHRACLSGEQTRLRHQDERARPLCGTNILVMSLGPCMPRFFLFGADSEHPAPSCAVMATTLPLLTYLQMYLPTDHPAPLPSPYLRAEPKDLAAFAACSACAWEQR